ncbi:hypothetical protein Dsin_017285 [Dipteronia sinensis]|uniref:Retrotransposon gag domain-containing protein n=1 Tax=Dipteronia sinensis TaxID=43782 RepID=A0AAE0AF05_9ROSI|nr:hypothetical protein Dsin_017285 [Dipteronia sinensis]
MGAKLAREEGSTVRMTMLQEIMDKKRVMTGAMDIMFETPKLHGELQKTLMVSSSGKRLMSEANTGPQEHVRRYQSAMAQYDYDEAHLCRMFPQTLGDQGSRWFSSLVSGSVGNLEELIHAFTRQFMGNIQHRKSISVLSTLKQRKDEKLKGYLARFSQEVSEVQNPNDDMVMAAFVNSL